MLTFDRQKFLASEELRRYMKFYGKPLLGAPLSERKGSNTAQWMNFAGQLQPSRMFKLDAEPHFQANPANNENALIREHERSVKFIDEALLKTCPVETLVKRFKSWFEVVQDSKLKNIKVKDLVNKDDISEPEDKLVTDCVYTREYDSKTKVAAIVGLYFPTDANDTAATEKELKSLVSATYVAGYVFVQHEVFKTTDPDINIVEAIFEARYTDFKPKLADVLYHVTPVTLLKKIAKNGLVPSSKNTVFSYPERVYLFNNEEINQMVSYAIDKTAAYLKSKPTSFKPQFALLRIDTKKLEADPKFKDGRMVFYVDPKYQNYDIHFPRAIYTYSGISADMIDDEVVIFDYDPSLEAATKRTKESLKSFT